MIKFYCYYLIYKYNLACSLFWSRQTIEESPKFQEKFLLFDHFKDFHFNSPHSQSSRTGSSWTIKGYMMSIFEKLSRSLVVNFWSLYNTQQTHERWIKSETTLLVNVHRRCFNVDIWLKMKVEPTYLYWRCFNISKTTLKQRWLNHVDSTSMNQSCFNVEIWLKMKFETDVCLSTLTK